MLLSQFIIFFLYYKAFQNKMGAIIDLCCSEQERKKGKIPKPKPIIQKKVLLKQETLLQYQNKISTSNQIIPPNEGDESQEFYQIQSLIDQRQKTLIQPKHISLNSFEILGQLGQGSFGSVLQVKYIQSNDDSKDHYYAMKVIPKQKLNTSKSMKGARIQRQILGKIQHPFITNLKFAFVDKNNFYLVMQRASQGDLSKIITIQSTRLFLKQNCKGYIRFISANIILGLQCLHKENIIYRDLKLQNVLIYKNGYVKLSDFGLSGFLNSHDEKRRTNAGTALYQAPQMILQLGYNWAIDLWALGVLIFQLQTGITPFKLEDVSTKIRFKRVAKEEQINRKWRGIIIDDSLRDLIGSLLKYNPQERLGYKSLEQLKNHEYFKSLNWIDVYQQKMESPLLPIIQKKKQTQQYDLPLPQQKIILKSSFMQTIPIEDEWNFNYKQKSFS